MSRWLIIVVAAAELIVVGMLIVGVDVPVPVRVVVGLVAAVAVLHELVRWTREFRGRRRAGAGRRTAAAAATADVLPAPVRTAMRWECRVWTGMIRGLSRQPDIPTGATAFTHHRALAPARWTLVGLLVVETAVVHLLVPSSPVRLTLLLLGLYGLIWLVGYLLGSGFARPHLLEPHRVVLRRGLTTDIVIPLDAVAQVGARRHHRAGTATIQVDGRTLSLVDNGGTGIEIVFSTPLLVTIPRRRPVEIDTIRAWVDEPVAMTAAIKQAIGGGQLSR